MELKDILEFRNRKNNFGTFLGIRTTRILPGHAECEMEIRPEFQNPIGSIHGGIIFTLADIAAGSAAASHGMQLTTMDSEMHYLNAGIRVRRLKGCADAIKEGHRISVIRVRILEENDKLLAEGTFTYFNLGKPLEF
jgi:acyl-CoA thioesterase